MWVGVAYPEGEIHVILDNAIVHRSKEVQAWHAKPKYRREVFHFLPTYSSWLNLIEVLFSLVEANVIRRGVFSTKELVKKILAYRSLQRGRTTVPLGEDRGRDPPPTQ